MDEPDNVEEALESLEDTLSDFGQTNTAGFVTLANEIRETKSLAARAIFNAEMAKNLVLDDVSEGAKVGAALQAKEKVEDEYGINVNLDL